MKAPYLVCYDISDDRRLTKVYRFLKTQGIHVQYSVFLCQLNWPELLDLKKHLSALIDPKEDDIRIYPLPGDLQVIVFGRGDRIPEGVTIFLE